MDHSNPHTKKRGTRSFIYSSSHKKGSYVRINRRKNLDQDYEDRNNQLRGMGFRSYAEYLSSGLWKTIRYAILQINPTCQLCENDKAVQVHHLDYDRSTLEGKNSAGLLSTCRDCHERVEFHKDGTKRTAQQALIHTVKLLNRAIRWRKAKEAVTQ